MASNIRKCETNKKFSQFYKSEYCKLFSQWYVVSFLSLSLSASGINDLAFYQDDYVLICVGFFKFIQSFIRTSFLITLLAHRS